LKVVLSSDIDDSKNSCIAFFFIFNGYFFKDGNFVPNVTFGPDTIRCCRNYTTLPFET